MPRINLTFLTFAFVFFSCVAYAADRPNILFIMSDDHACNAISAYGGRLAKVAPTPNIDRLAKEGMRLNRCYVTNSICTPSRAVILSGQHSHLNQVKTLVDAFPGPDAGVPNLADILPQTLHLTFHLLDLQPASSFYCKRLVLYAVGDVPFLQGRAKTETAIMNNYLDSM